VEEQFYLIWPVVFLILMSRMRGWALQCCLTLAAIGTFYSVYTQGTHTRLDISTETNIFALLLGCALAFTLSALRRTGAQLPRSQPLLPFAVMIGLSALPGHGLSVDHGLFRPLGVVFALVGTWLVAAAATGSSRAVSSPPMVFFGTISYALYLWHQALINSPIGGQDHTIARNLLLVAVAVVVSWLSWVLVERPLGRLRGPLHLDRPSKRQQQHLNRQGSEDEARPVGTPVYARE
jgi:peptidoglycan/LPS O-acetylase OafA/YrhL